GASPFLRVLSSCRGKRNWYSIIQLRGKTPYNRSWDDMPMTTNLYSCTKPLPGNTRKDGEEGTMTQSDIDATTPQYLRNKYAIVGVGETTYRRGSQESTRNLATWAVNNALDDAGLAAPEVDRMLSDSGNDTTLLQCTHRALAD